MDHERTKKEEGVTDRCHVEQQFLERFPKAPGVATMFARNERVLLVIVGLYFASKPTVHGPVQSPLLPLSSSISFISPFLSRLQSGESQRKNFDSDLSPGNAGCPLCAWRAVLSPV